MSDEMKPRRYRRSLASRRSGLPKGGYRLPEGGIMLPVRRMPGSRVSIRAVLREKPDTKLIADALVQLVIDEARVKNPNNSATYDTMSGEVARERIFKVLRRDATDGSKHLRS